MFVPRLAYGLHGQCGSGVIFRPEQMELILKLGLLSQHLRTDKTTIAQKTLI